MREIKEVLAFWNLEVLAFWRCNYSFLNDKFLLMTRVIYNCNATSGFIKVFKKCFGDIKNCNLFTL